MEIQSNVLKQGIARLSDYELRSRWAAKQFTSEALPIAEEELKRRGLAYSENAIEAAASERKSEIKVAGTIRFQRLSQQYMVGAALAGVLVGVGRFGMIATLAASVIFYALCSPLSSWISSVLARRFENDRRQRVLLSAVISFALFVGAAIMFTVLGIAFLR